MRSLTRRTVNTLSVVAASLIATLATPLQATGADGTRKLSFDVFLDDRAIGYQRFSLTPAGEALRIETQARFEVKVLRITAFSYDHRNTEVWRGGCLRSIDAFTDSNGKKSAVSGRAQGNAFVVATKDGERALGDCVATFAYWDKGILLRSQTLLNSQTGEHVPVRIAPLGAGTQRIGSRDLPVARFAIKGKGIDITLAYTPDSDEWVALDSKMEGGRTLRYRRDIGELDRATAAQPPRTGGVASGR
jgi:hypothetical protein